MLKLVVALSSLLNFSLVAGVDRSITTTRRQTGRKKGGEGGRGRKKGEVMKHLLPQGIENQEDREKEKGRWMDRTGRRGY